MTETNSIDKNTLQTILENLVTEPDKINIDRVVDEQGVLLKVRVSGSDMGIVIGRSGVMANSLKTIMRALGKANKMNIRVEFMEPDGSQNKSSDKNIDKKSAEDSESSTVQLN